MNSKPTTEERDRRVLELYDQLLEIEQRLIPTGLHIFGAPPRALEMESLLQMVASFERSGGDGSEPVAEALTELVAEGLEYPSYSILLSECAADEQRMRQRERVEQIVREAIRTFLGDAVQSFAPAAAFLLDAASVPVEKSVRVFELLSGIRTQLGRNNELDSLIRALHGEYIEPGPGADIIQNPGVLPTGRNTYAINPYAVPSAAAVKRAEHAVSLLLERRLNESGIYPETMAMVLWGIDNIKTQGEAVAQALLLMGVKPRRDSLNRATGVDVIPPDRLGRPRIDVVMTVSGIFRDLFAPTMSLLDLAVRTVAQLDEPDHINFVRQNVRNQMNQQKCSLEEAATRVFSNAPGNYGTNVNFMVLDSQWNSSNELGDLFVTRKCFAYGKGKQGADARELLDRALARVELTYQNIDSTEIGLTDVDHYFEYLGGVSKAVETRSGTRPRIYISDSTSPRAAVRTLEETVKLETRTKTLNPKWYEGMLEHGFSGVAEIEHHVTNTFGWSATADAVEAWIYDEIARTFIFDDAMLERLRSLNPYAVRSMVNRLLEASTRGYWSTDESIVERLRDVVAGLEQRIEGVGA